MAKDKPLPFDAAPDAPDWLAYDPREEIAWRPEPGDKIAGKVIDIDLRTVIWKDQERTVPVLVLDTGEEHNVYAVWCMNTVLANEVRKLGPQVGDRLGVVRQEDSENGYKRYKVVSPDAKGRRFNWQQLTPRAETDEVPPRSNRRRMSEPFYQDDLPI